MCANIKSFFSLLFFSLSFAFFPLFCRQITMDGYQHHHHHNNNYDSAATSSQKSGACETSNECKVYEEVGKFSAISKFSKDVKDKIFDEMTRHRSIFSVFTIGDYSYLVQYNNNDLDKVGLVCKLKRVDDRIFVTFEFKEAINLLVEQSRKN